LIIAPTGEFGRHITRECLKLENLLVSVLVRNPDKEKDLMEQITKSGGRVIKGDLTKPETLIDVTKGIHTVISAVVGDFKTVVEGQKLILEDGIKNGLKRFAPSEFGLDVWGKIPKGEHYFVDQRLTFREILSKSKVPGLHFTLGMFMEAFAFFNRESFTYWGSPDTKLDLTSQEDAARYLAAAVANMYFGDIMVIGDELTIIQARDIYNKITGKNLALVKGGTIEDLKKKAVEAREKGDFSSAIAYGYGIFVWDGRAKIKDRMNSEFPEVKPLSFEDFVKKYGPSPSYDFFVGNIPKNVEEDMKNHKWGPISS